MISHNVVCLITQVMKSGHKLSFAWRLTAGQCLFNMLLNHTKYEELLEGAHAHMSRLVPVRWLALFCWCRAVYVRGGGGCVRGESTGHVRGTQAFCGLS